MSKLLSAAIRLTCTTQAALYTSAHPTIQLSKTVNPSKKVKVSFVRMNGREIILPYEGKDFTSDERVFRQQLQLVESRHLPYFINRPGIFEDDPFEHLHNHFFFVQSEQQVILLQAESSDLPPEIVKEVQEVFTDMFGEV